MVTKSIPEWVRTTNLRLRRPTLYPIELREQMWKSQNVTVRAASGEVNCRAVFSKTSTEATKFLFLWFRPESGPSERGGSRHIIFQSHLAQDRHSPARRPPDRGSRSTGTSISRCARWPVRCRADG